MVSDLPILAFGASDYHGIEPITMPHGTAGRIVLPVAAPSIRSLPREGRAASQPAPNPASAGAASPPFRSMSMTLPETIAADYPIRRDTRHAR